jgi:tetratricopeptide (TPR) repeat protein
MKKMQNLVCQLALVATVSRVMAPGAAASVTDTPAAEANAAYEAKDWARAASLYEELSKEKDPPPRVWLRLGASLRSLGKYEEALAAFDKATQMGAGQFGEYGKGATYAAMKQPDQAFESLARAVQQGYADPDALRGDPNLGSLHGDVRFGRLVEQAKKNARPCAYTAENRQFDFWLGTWDVSTTQGSIPAGTSKIELILEGCVVLENWKSLNSPYSGKSYNVYDQALKRWEQYWVDNVGGNIFFHGELLKDGVMDYWTDDIPQSTGPSVKRHLQFIAMGPDKVRQLSRGSTDGGVTWNVEYDFLYVRKSASAHQP